MAVISVIDRRRSWHSTQVPSFTLNSGGQRMTVVEVAEDEIVCMWTSEEGALFREAIPASR